MTTPCKYHPEENASWYCGRCDVAFCMRCVPEDDVHQMPRCTLCRSHLEPTGISDSITPFWLKIGHFFAYPLHPPLLIVNLITTVIAFFFFNPQGISLFGAVLMLVTSIFLVKVYFSIMEYTAHGNMDSPDWNKMMGLGNGWMFLKLIAMYLIVIGVTYKLFLLSWALAVSLLVFLVIGFPAINMILCMDKSMWSALNPMRIIYVMSAIGGTYWILFGLIILFVLSSSFGTGFLQTQISPTFGVPMASFFSTYIMFAMYHMFGYVIYQYHYELDFSVRRDTLHKNIRQHGKHTSHLIKQSEKEEKSGGVTEAEILIQEGRYEGAEQVLIDAIRSNDQDLNAYEKLYRLYELQGNAKGTVQLCKKHLTVLSKLRNANLMKMAYQKAIAVMPHFRPDDPVIAHQLIKTLNRKEELKTALGLLNYLKKEHIQYEGLADACFTLGKNIVEKLNRREEAANIIRWGVNVAHGEQKTTMENYLKLLG